MRKRKRVPPVVRPSPRRPSTRWDEERRTQRLVFGLGGLVVIVVAAIAAFGYYQTEIRPKGETVVQVGDRSFSLQYLERRVRYDIREGNTTYAANLAQAAQLLVDEIGREELMRQGAPEKGVDLSDGVIDAEIASREGVPTNADRNTFAEAYRKAVRSSGLSTQGYRDVIAADLAGEAVQTKFEEGAAETAEQVRFRAIVLATEEDAQAALDRIHNGEDFAVVAQEVSLDTASAGQGGEHDWIIQGVTDPALDEALFSLEVGQLSEVITGQNAFFIVEVLEKAADRETTDAQRSSLASQAKEEWLADLGERLGVTISLDADKQGSIIEAVQSEAGSEQ